MAGARNAPKRSALRRARFALLLAFALVFVQALGLVHGVAHFKNSPTSGHDGTAAAKAFALQALFSGHDDAHDCQLFDQASHADLAGAAGASGAAVAEPAEPAEAHAAWHVAAQAQGFLARAPPSVS